ncbi:hypothetical protein ACGFY9_02150 [Streptomyces sp. NPDC048504]|uniref:hypothetical protein n=1 Tax=Streptomyces sp. NPDC048504 TaxID=3365559 RepID=UPI003717CB4B
MLVAAFSAVVAFGTLAGLSGVRSDAHRAGSGQSVTVAADTDETLVYPLDSRWD